MCKNYFRLIIAILFVSNVMAQNIPSYVPKDGLVGYWPFNGNANDESGNGNHGTVNGATLTVDRNGVSNNSYNFDGNTNYILVKDSPKLQLNEISISYWVKTENTNPMYLICKQNINDASNSNYVIQFNPLPSGANTHRFHSSYNSCPNTSWQINDYKSTFTDNVWHNFISIVSVDSLKFYFDGNLIYTSQNSSGKMTACNGSELLFGRGWNNFPHYFKGQLDDIAIYNRALSDQEVKQLYEGCSKETATSSSFNTLMYTTNAPVNLTATPTGGTFSGNSVINDTFNPAKAKLGKNTVKYNFKNTTGCIDSTDFAMLVVDTVGATCTKYDTVVFNKTKYDTITITNNVTKYDTITIKNNVFDTVKVTKFDTVTVTNNVTKYDTVKVTKFDTITIKNNVYDTVTITNNVTKYDTITITNNITKYDTVIVNKTNYDTVSILKIKFKLTTGIHANQLSSLSIYPNPTSDVLHIEVPDVKALEGYRYRILDALGKEVYNELVTQTTTEIPLKTLGAAGMYQFEIIDAKNTSIQSNKIVLQ